MKKSTFAEYARTELISIISDMKPTNEACFVHMFCYQVIS